MRLLFLSFEQANSSLWVISRISHLSPILSPPLVTSLTYCVFSCCASKRQHFRSAGEKEENKIFDTEELHCVRRGGGWLWWWWWYLVEVWRWCGGEQ